MAHNMAKSCQEIGRSDKIAGTFVCMSTSTRKKPCLTNAEKEEKFRMNREQRIENERARRVAEWRVAVEREASLRRQAEAERERHLLEIRQRDAERRRQFQVRRQALDQKEEARRLKILAKYSNEGGGDGPQQNKTTVGKKCYAFGSSTPRTLAYLEHLGKEQRAYDTKLRPLITSAIVTSDEEGVTPPLLGRTPLSACKRPNYSRPSTGSSKVHAMSASLHFHSTPRNLAYLEHTGKEQRLYGSKLRPATTPAVVTSDEEGVALPTLGRTPLSASRRPNASRPSTGSSRMNGPMSASLYLPSRLARTPRAADTTNGQIILKNTQKATPQKQPTPYTQATLHDQGTALNQTRPLNRATPQNKATPQKETTPQNQATPQSQITPHIQSVLQNQVNPLSQATPLNQINLLSQATPHNQATSQNESTPQNQTTPRSEATPQYQATPQNQATSQNQVTSHTQITPLYTQATLQNKIIPQSQATPLNQIRLLKQATPYNQATPQNQATLQNQLTSENQATPHNQTTPQNQATPQNQLTPQNQATPHNQTTPQNQATPKNQLTPQNQATPHNQTTPQTQATPQNHATPQDQATPQNQATFQLQGMLRNQATPPHTRITLQSQVPLQSQATPLNQIRPPNYATPQTYAAPSFHSSSASLLQKYANDDSELGKMMNRILSKVQSSTAASLATKQTHCGKNLKNFNAPSPDDFCSDNLSLHLTANDRPACRSNGQLDFGDVPEICCRDDEAPPKSNGVTAMAENYGNRFLLLATSEPVVGSGDGVSAHKRCQPTLALGQSDLDSNVETKYDLDPASTSSYSKIAKLVNSKAELNS